MSVVVMRDQELHAAVRVQGVKLQLLDALADLASDPLDQRRADAMRQALGETEEIRHLLQQARHEARHRPHLTLLPQIVEEDIK